MITPECKTSLSLNIINFFFFGGISCIIPFLSVHARSIGLTSWHITCVHMASGLICILVPLVVGTIAEKRGKSPKRFMYKSCFCCSLFLAILGYTALLALPKIHRIHKQPQIDFDCSSPMNAVINLEKCSNYEACSDVAAAWPPNTRFRLSHCRFKYKGSEDLRPHPPDPTNPLQMCFRSTGNTTHHCLVYDPQVNENPTLEFTSDLRSWQFTEYRNVSAKEFSFSDVSWEESSLNICNYVPASSGTIIQVNDKMHDAVTCQRSLTDQVVGIKCVLVMHNPEGGKTPCFDIVGDLSLTFWSYVALRAAADAFFMTALCLLEGVTLRAIQGGPYNRGAYGRTRLSPASAMVLFPVIVGLLVDYFSEMADTPYYTLAYFLMAACELLVCLLIFVLPLPVGGNTFRYVISQPDYATSRTYDEDHTQKFGVSFEMIVISVVTVFSGAAWGLSQVFDPLLYQDIGFNHLLLGAAQSFVFLFAMPFLLVSKNLLHNIGEVHLICTAFAFHSLHLAGLSFTKEWRYWWWATPFEAMKAFTIPILWLAVVATAEHESSKGRKIAMQYVLVVLHFGIGRILGCSVGGLLAEKYSLSLSYRAMSGFCFIIAILYLCFHHCFMKPRHRRIIAERCVLQRQSMNGSHLLLVEPLPVNGRIVPRNNN